jgi:hypothetical protein
MITYILDSEDKSFTFEFSFSPSEPLSPDATLINDETINDNGGSYLELAVFRSDLPDLKFHWSGYTTTTKKIPLEVPQPPAPDQNCCKGSFCLYKNSYTGMQCIWMDLEIGNGYEGIFLGCMVEFPMDISTP